MTEYKVGIPYPGKYRKQDCGTMAIAEDGGVSIIITLEDIKTEEVAAFKTKIQYGLFTDYFAFPIIIWVWDSPPPVNKIETPFNLALEPTGRQDAFLAEQKNLWSFFLIEWNTGILKAMKMKSLDQSLIAKMHQIARLQLTSQENYDRSLNMIYKVFTDSYALWHKCQKGKDF